MSAHRRSVHVDATFHWRTLAEVAPDLGVMQQPANGAQPETPMALMFVDPGGEETHIYVFAETGRQALIAALTGGIVVPK